MLINGDVLTKVNVQNLLIYHNQNSAYINIYAREHVLQSPYGILEVDDIKYKTMVEEPSFKHLMNAVIYFLDPEILYSIKENEFLDMPNLINSFKKQNKNIFAYPLHEYWIDIVKLESLEKAIDEWQINIDSL